MKLVSGGRSINTQQGRLYYLDWLRVMVVLAVFYAHTTDIFNTLSWHIRNGQQNPGLEALFTFLSYWGMSLMFLLAGASACFGLRSRTGGQFLSERFKRLVIPFIAGFIILSPLLAYIEALIHSPYPASFVQFYPHFFASIQVSWNLESLGGYSYHLWFLAFLFLISALALPLIMYLRREQSQQFITRLAALSARPGGLFVFVLPLATLHIALQLPFPGYQNWANFFAWLVYFLYGYILFSDPRFARAIEKQGKIALLAAIACSLILMAWVLTGVLHTLGTTSGYSVDYMLYQFLYSMTAWSWVVFILFVGMRFLNASNRVIQYGNEAVLPFYILHYPVLFFTTFCVMQLESDTITTFLIVSTASLIATLTIYELLIRRMNIMRWLFGMKPRKPVVRKDVERSFS
jgi:peptidoglycan/LPS O-acetylase OafA/YrhL